MRAASGARPPRRRSPHPAGTASRPIPTKEFARMRAFRSSTLGTALVAALATTGFAGAAQAAPPPGPPAPGGGAKAGQQQAPALTGAEAARLERQDALLPVA